MDDSLFEATLPKILLKYQEFQRLKFIEEQYLELQQKYSELSLKRSSKKDLDESEKSDDRDDNDESINQTGDGDNESNLSSDAVNKTLNNQIGFGDDTINQISSLVYQKLLSKKGKI